MSLASQLKEQNETLVGVKDGVESLNASFIKFFNLDEQKKTRERLQDKERQQDSKTSRGSLFGIFGGSAKKTSAKKDDKEFKGLLGGAGGQLTQAILGTRLLTMMGGRGGKGGGMFASAAKGIVGLGLFAFADAIASEVDKLNPGSPEIGDMAHDIAKSGGLGYLLFGRKGAVAGILLSIFNTDENRALLEQTLKNLDIDPEKTKAAAGGIVNEYLKSLNRATEKEATISDYLVAASPLLYFRSIRKGLGTVLSKTFGFGKNLIFGKGATKGAGAAGAAGRQGMFSKMSDAVGKRAGAFMDKKPLQSAVTGARNALVAGGMKIGVLPTKKRGATRVSANGKSGEAITKILNNKKFQKVLGALNKIPGGRYLATIPAMATVLSRTDLSQEEKKREFVNLFGGIGGAVLGAAVGGLLTSPGGPLAALGVLGGGILGGFGGEYIAGLLYDYIMGDNKSSPTISSEAVSSQGLDDLGLALSTPDLIPDRVKPSVQKPIPQQGMQIAEASMMRDRTSATIYRAGDNVAIDNSSRSSSSHLLGATSSSVDTQDPTFRTRKV